MNKKKVILELAMDFVRAFAKDAKVDKESYTEKHPWLNDKKSTHVKVYFDGKEFDAVGSLYAKRTLIDDIERNVEFCVMNGYALKVSADEIDKIKLAVFVQEEPQMVSYFDPNDLIEKLPNPKNELYSVQMAYNGSSVLFLADRWLECDYKKEMFLGNMLDRLGLPMQGLEFHPEIAIVKTELYED